MSDPISWSDHAGARVCVCAVGGRTPLGFSAAASAAAVRGAISAIAAHSVFMDKVGEPMSMARDPGLDPQLPIARRMQAMLVSSVAEVLGDPAFTPDGRPLTCWIGVPEPRPGLPADIARSVSSAVSNAFGLPTTAIHVLQRGHAAGLMALQVAAQKMAAGQTEACIVAGVDSYHDPGTLEWLDRDGRLMSSENRNGFPPSEAAGACLIATRACAQRSGLPELAYINAATTALEPHPIGSPGVCTGEGLTAALNGVVASRVLPEQAITATYCDLNGQRYRNEEFVYALLRTQQAFVDAHDYECPADCWGDVGAASGPLLVSLAICANRRGYAKGAFPIAWAGSESGYRTAILLTLPSR